MSKLSLICELLGINVTQARIFCEQVQVSFQGAPSYKMIGVGLSQLPAEKRTVESVVALLQNVQPHLRLVSDAIIKRMKVSGISKSIPKPSQVIHHSSRGVGGFSDAIKGEAFSPILSHDPRKYLDGFEKCPHGIPKFSKCAICDPEGFRDKMGID